MVAPCDSNEGMKQGCLGHLVAVACGLNWMHASEGPWLNEPPVAPPGWHSSAPPDGGVGPRPALGGFTVDTSSRETVRLFHLSVHAASEGVESGWAGDVASGIAGETTPEFQDAVIRRVNYFRALCGVPSWIRRSGFYGAKAQQAALMMSANRMLSHYPAPSWAFYTTEGAEAAAKSNLYLGGWGPSSVDGYMLDPGANNAAVGHRRWILYPNTRNMGTGDIPPQPGYWAANCLWVFDSAQSTLRPGTRDSFVQWPPHGHVPYSLVPGRWSFSYPDADFSGATVTMHRDGVELPVAIEPVSNGYGDNTLVWIPAGMNPNATDHPAPEQDVRYSVRIDGAIVSGDWQTFETEVVVFDPTRPGPDAIDTVPSGPAELVAGTSGTFTIPTVPGASGYRWSHAQLTPSQATWGAEDPSDGVVLGVTPGYEARVEATAAEGGWCYRLAHPSATVQTLTLDRTFLAGTGTELRFSKMVGLATTGQVARAEIQVGGAWTTVWREAGSGAGFVPKVQLLPVAIPLAQHAGRSFRVRFVYEATGSWFPQTLAGCGLYLDSIRVAGSDEVGSEASTDVVGNTFVFSTGTPGTWLLQAGPILFGDYFTGNGTGWQVRVKEGGELTLAPPVVGPDGNLLLEFLATGGAMGPFVVESVATMGPGVTWLPAKASGMTDLGDGRHRVSVVAATGHAFFRVRTAQ